MLSICLLRLSQCIPHDWKHDKVIPLFKDGVRDDIDNYRPISILPVVSTILERAVQQQLVDHLESQNLFSRLTNGVSVVSIRHRVQLLSLLTP